ncbi:probable LRR receptor-like serine/threonine-protein kinase At1g07650 isoform X2 [Humulus lupulus]|uniref:probable LRR receptor-like serine/threonine-protein kinase At1g07650 isoform X2 n=1 Tax=Humulus lupulus TaxID=3486 RepID=UPI002B412683|nr:probable LRR receptor-like serine/threonine-protein kinase At1g07650 isoform X2 [Humulus lupulus]
MDMIMLYWHNFDKTRAVKQLSVIFFFLLIAAVDYVASSPYSGSCSLDFKQSTPLFSSSCEGDWGGFLEKSCCGAAFSEYLYVLGQRANQTGKLFLNSTEQGSCLVLLTRFRGNISGCGIEKLVSGNGGCSDYSLDDVTNKLGDRVRSLNENCELTSSKGTWESSCDFCVKSWEDIRGMDSPSAKHEPVNIENEMCRFAVLVSIIGSRIEDVGYIRPIFTCLGGQTLNSEREDIKHSKKNSIRKGVWILIGFLIGVVMMVLVAACFLYRRYFKSNLPSKNHVFRDVLTKEPACRKVPVKEVYAATNNLCESNVIGEGTAGKVYKGILSNKQPVAIKHIINDEDVETFVRELTSLAHIRHPNLVALLGCCVRKDDGFLIYELCPNGNLSEWLFGRDKVLSWIQRLEIAIDCARALWFLHSCPEGCIVHRDIKPTNILLGKHFEAKLSDFGLSKVMSLGESFVCSEVRGTFGYVDPDYQSNHRVKSSGDVYSFGVVLLQIISGKRVINMKLRRPMPLNKMAKVLSRDGKITEFADPKLEGAYSAEAFVLVLELALSCTALKTQRPSMEQIVSKLEGALDKSTRAKVSTPETTQQRNA